jgi:hypothetical protein
MPVSSLEGICLVILSDRGHQLVFHSIPSSLSSNQDSLASIDINKWIESSVVANTNDLDNENKQQSSSINYPFQSLYGFSPVAFSRLCVPQKSICERFEAFVISIDELTIVSRPISVTAGDEIALFNVVVVLKNVYLEKVKERLDIVSNQLSRFAASMRFEQLRSEYLTKEVRGMLRVRESMCRALKAENFMESDAIRLNVFSKVIYEHSELAKDLQKFHVSLESEGYFSTLMNRSISLSSNFSNHSQTCFDLKPYQTLLLRKSVFDILNAAKTNLAAQASSSTFKKFLSFISPLKSFLEASLELDLSLTYIYAIANHLVQWEMARVISTMTKNSVFIVSSSVPFVKSGSLNSNEWKTEFCIKLYSLQSKFNILFPNHSLFEVLDRFSTIRRLDDHLRGLNNSSQQEVIRMIIWLLQKRFIVQTNVYLFLQTNAWKNLVSASQSTSDEVISDDFNDDVSMHDAHLSVDPTNLSEESSPITIKSNSIGFQGSTHSTLSFSYASPSQISRKSLRIFRRLVPYFDGKSHIEEIMWRENISRNEMMQVLKDFVGYVVPALHDI